MALERLGSFVTRFPWLAIIATLLITSVAISGIVIKGLDTEFEEETFLPDIEMAKANMEVEDEYTGTYSVSILVKAEDDVLTTQALIEMLEIEDAIVSDKNVKDKLESPNTYTSAVSVADIIAQTIFMAEFQDALLIIMQEKETQMLESINSSIYATFGAVVNQTIIDNLTSTMIYNLSYALQGIFLMEQESLNAKLNETLNETKSRISFQVNDLILNAAQDLNERLYLILTNETLSNNEKENDCGAEVLDVTMNYLPPEINNITASELSKSLDVNSTIESTLENLSYLLAYEVGSQIGNLIFNATESLSESITQIVMTFTSLNESEIEAMFEGQDELVIFINETFSSMLTEKINETVIKLGADIGDTFNASLEKYIDDASINSTIFMDAEDNTFRAINLTVSGNMSYNELNNSVESNFLNASINVTNTINATLDYIPQEVSYALTETMNTTIDTYLENDLNSMISEIANSIYATLYNQFQTLITEGIKELSTSESNFTEQMIGIMNSLSFKDKGKTLKGGNLSVYFNGIEIELNFKEMNDTELKNYIVYLLTSNETSDAIKGSFPLMLTKDFNLTEGNIKAKATVINIFLNASIGKGEGENEQDERLSAERDIDRVVESLDLEEIKISTIGSYIIGDEIMTANDKSLAILLPLAFALVIIILAVVYRNLFDTTVSLLALFFAIIWLYGFGAWMEYTFNPLSTMVPVLVVGLGIDYGIHITMRYREELRKGNDIRKSITATAGSVGVALLLATVTTVAAFLSNLASPIDLLAQFGVLCAVGIIGSFVTFTTFVPACKMLRDEIRERKGKPLLRDLGKDEEKKGPGVRMLNKGISAGAVAAEHHPVAVIAITVIITLASTWLALKLDTEFDFEDFLPDELEISKDIKFIIREFEVFGGEGESVYILVKGDITDPQLLRDIDETVNNMRDDRYVIKHGNEPKVESILSLMYDYAHFDNATGVQDMRFSPSFAYNYSLVMENGVPRENATSADIKALYLQLIELSEKDCKSVLHWSNDKFDGTVLRISVNTGDKEDKVLTLYTDLKEDKKPLENSSEKAIITGGPILTHVIINAINESQIRSMIITLIVSFIVLTIVFWIAKRSLVLGGITVIPVILVVSWILGTMYIADVPLNVMTISIASFTIGLGVTYAIHITHRFLEDVECNEIDLACRNTVSHTGTALFGAAATTIAGFALLIFSLLPPMKQFGGITALTILFSFLSSVFILPTLLVLWAKAKRKGSLSIKTFILTV